MKTTKVHRERKGMVSLDTICRYVEGIQVILAMDGNVVVEWNAMNGEYVFLFEGVHSKRSAFTVFVKYYEDDTILRYIAHPREEIYTVTIASYAGGMDSLIAFLPQVKLVEQVPTKIYAEMKVMREALAEARRIVSE